MRARDTQRRSRTRWWLIAFALATMAVWQRYAVVQLGGDAEELQKSVTELTRERDQLLTETAALGARERIEQIAKTKLGMRPTPTDAQRTLAVEDNEKQSTNRDLVAEPR